MPNHAYTKIKIRGNKESVARIKNRILVTEDELAELKPSESICTKKSMRLYDKQSTLIRHNWQLRPIEVLYRSHYPDSYRNSMLDDYRLLLAEHNRAEMMEQIDFHALFADESIMTPISPVDAEYWQNHTEVPSWGLGV